MSTLDGEPREVSESTQNLGARFLQEPVIQGPLVSGSSSIQENVHVKPKARRKRTRPEFETGFVVSHESASADACEFLGPDIRALRPLPHKVRNENLVLDEDTTARGVPCGVPSRVPSLEHADQLLRNVASNALAVLQAEVGPDVPDWTQGEEQDAECDDLDGHDQDEANDVQITTAASAPSMVTPKPPVPAPPRMWAQVGSFTLPVNLWQLTIEKSRQEVCESFEYFRSYHSGVYSKDDIVKGYLLGAYAARCVFLVMLF